MLDEIGIHAQSLMDVEFHGDLVALVVLKEGAVVVAMIQVELLIGLEGVVALGGIVEVELLCLLHVMVLVKLIVIAIHWADAHLISVTIVAGNLLNCMPIAGI